MGMSNKGADALKQLVDPRPRVTRAELATWLGLKPAAVGEWLRGKNRPSSEVMKQLEDKYGIPMRSWFEASDEDGSDHDLAAHDDPADPDAG